MTIPTKPAGYWRPEVSLTDVYYLRGDGTWWLSPSGTQVPESEVPDDLQHLGDYVQPYLDPKPWVTYANERRTDVRSKEFDIQSSGETEYVRVLEPRPGYSQNIEDYT